MFVKTHEVIFTFPKLCHNCKIKSTENIGTFETNLEMIRDVGWPICLRCDNELEPDYYSEVRQ